MDAQAESPHNAGMKTTGKIFRTSAAGGVALTLTLSYETVAELAMEAKDRPCTIICAGSEMMPFLPPHPEEPISPARLPPFPMTTIVATTSST